MIFFGCFSEKRTIRNQSRIRNSLLLLVIPITAIPAFAWALNEEFVIDPASLLDQLYTSNGRIPWTPDDGYRLSGQYLRRDDLGESIRYEATYVRLGDEWATDFSHEDSSRNMRYVASGYGAWASSPEVVAEVTTNQLPYPTRYDFLILYHELLQILKDGSANPRFKIEKNGSDLFVHGNLRSGEEATFLLNTVQYFPRRVSVRTPSNPLPSWLATALEPDGTVTLTPTRRSSPERFEVWFSDPREFESYRLPTRTDYVDTGGVTGSFFIEAVTPCQRSDRIFIRPFIHPWEREIEFTPSPSFHSASLYLREDDLTAFRSKLDDSPWATWRHFNSIVATWTQIALLASPMVPVHSPFFALLLLCALMILLLLLSFRRLFRSGRRTLSWLVLLGGGMLLGFALVASFASTQLHSPENHSAFALHTAIRYTITGDSSFGDTSESILVDLAAQPAPQSSLQLARACQDYALAYDLIRPLLPRERQQRIEALLFDHARMLYGGLHGRRFHTSEGSIMAAGLGMVGITIRYDPYLQLARDCLEQVFRTQLEEGLHREGLGVGNVAMENIANFMYALKHSEAGNYYKDPAFLEYVHTLLQLSSPLGTLPLFGDTSLEQGANMGPFLLKVAGHIPADLGHQAISVHDTFWKVGFYSSTGWRMRVEDTVQPFLRFLRDPYPLFHYERPLPAKAPSGRSEALGGAQIAVLRSGKGTDALYLAINSKKLNPANSHRDILSFDLYAYQALLLHGAGSPGRDDDEYEEATQTAAGNSITFDGRNQSEPRGTGVILSLLNQPTFDVVRVGADRTYDEGKVQRDAILVRPDEDHPGYFLLVDEVHTNAPETRVSWYLHGKGILTSGADQIPRWTSQPFAPPGSGSSERVLAAYSFGMEGLNHSVPSQLYSRSSFLHHHSEALILEWEGSRRFCTVLFPRLAGQPEPEFESIGQNGNGRIGESDWIGFGDLKRRRTIGPLEHISEYAVLREHADSFPSILMVQGIEFQIGAHRFSSTKPITVSLSGLRGGLLNARPDTRLELRSPEIEPGDRFLLDQHPLFAADDGTLTIILEQAGKHSLRPAP